MTTKERPIIFDAISVKAILTGNKTQTRRVVNPQGNRRDFDCPYGYPGDRLWVREAWYVQPELWQVDHGPQPVEYAECSPANQVEDYVLKPAMYMPRWASRITLQVVDIRVERVQEISDEDCEAEIGGKAFPAKDSARFLFLKRWDDINAKRGYPLAANPWVWVVEFQMVQS